MSSSKEWERQFAESAGSLGLVAEDFRKQVMAGWQLTPFVAEYGHLSKSVHGCFGGTWQGRRASATMVLPVSGQKKDINVFFSMYSHAPMEFWSDGTLLVTSVGFVAGVVPLMAAAPTAPHRINEHMTYESVHWLPGLVKNPYGVEIPVPGDLRHDWVVRSLNTEKPSAVLAAIAPLLLSEPAYPWKIDGGKNGGHAVDLVRIDIAAADAPPPSAELVRDRLDRLSQLATTIENALSQYTAQHG